MYSPGVSGTFTIDEALTTRARRHQPDVPPRPDRSSRSKSRGLANPWKSPAGSRPCPRRSSPSRCATCRRRSRSSRAPSWRSRARRPCATCCATSPASPSRPAKAACRPAISCRSAASARAPTCSSTACATSAATRATPFNIEQVEVAKGPSSTLAGRGSTGGAINHGQQGAGLVADCRRDRRRRQRDYQRSTLDVNQPLAGIGHSRHRVRVNAMWTDTECRAATRSRASRWGVAPSLAFGLGTPTR